MKNFVIWTLRIRIGTRNAYHDPTAPGSGSATGSLLLHIGVGKCPGFISESFGVHLGFIYPPPGCRAAGLKQKKLRGWGCPVCQVLFIAPLNIGEQQGTGQGGKDSQEENNIA